MLTRWMNPAAVNQVLRIMANSLENFRELLEEEGQRVVEFWQVPEQHKYLILKILATQSVAHELEAMICLLGVLL